MFEKTNKTNDEVEVKGTVKMIKEAVEQLQAKNSAITMAELKEKVIEMYPTLNKNTLNTQISKIMAAKDKERPFKNALKDLHQKGNLALIGDEEKIAQLISLYNSTMTVEEAVAFLKGKSNGTKTLKITDLQNYVLVKAGKEESTDTAITFANTVIYARKA